MALPELDGEGIGFAVMPFLHTGAKWIAPRGDDNGHLQVDAAGGDKIFSLECPISGAKQNTNCQAGSNSLVSDPVPAGKLWVIHIAQCRYVGTVPTRIYAYVDHPTYDTNLIMEYSPATNICHRWLGTVLLEEGETIRTWVDGATAGDDFYLEWAGYQMNAP